MSKLVTEQLHFGVLLLISFILFNTGYIVDQTIRWSDHFHGFMNGVCHVIMNGIAWCIFILPWSLLIFGLFRWRKWNRFRAHVVLAPVAMVLVMMLSNLVVFPPTPSNRLKSLTKVDLPKDIKNLNYYFSGGGITDYHDEYYFETSPLEIQRLISEMDLHEGGGYSNAADLEGSYLNFPDFISWKNSTVYARNDQ